MYRFDVKDILKEAALEDLEEQAEQSAVALQKISATGTKFQEVGGKSESVGKTLLPVSADLGATTAFSSGEVAEAMNTYTQLGLDDAKNEMIRMEELEQARKEVDKTEGIKPMKQNMFKVV